jgi:hypothetical protein
MYVKGVVLAMVNAAMVNAAQSSASVVRVNYIARDRIPSKNPMHWPKKQTRHLRALLFLKTSSPVLHFAVALQRSMQGATASLYALTSLIALMGRNVGGLP